VLAHNDKLVEKPGLLNEDAFAAGWMLVARPASGDWRAGFVTGPQVAVAFGALIESEA
jgi:glycine cleavage system H lipoate-binding protein